MRKLEKKLEKYIDDKLKNNGLAQEAIKTKNFRILMVQAAAALVGIKEKTGHNDGEMIELLQMTIGDAENESYCAGGIQSVVAYCEIRTGIKSHLKATEGAQDMYKSSAVKFRVKAIPLPGAIMCWGDINSWTGHVEIVIAADDKVIHCIGFNTSGSTNPNSQVNREGNGVYYTVRNYKSTKTRKLLGFIKPV